MVVLAAKAGLAVDDEQAYPRIGEIPFDSRRKRMTTFHELNGAGSLGSGALPSGIVSFCKVRRMYCSPSVPISTPMAGLGPY